MPEEFAFEKGIGNGATVYGDELVVHTGDCLGDKFLADTSFALDENRSRVENGAFHGFSELLHGLALADQVAHAFAENFSCVVDFLELCDARHQVDLEGFHGENAVVELA